MKKIALFSLINLAVLLLSCESAKKSQTQGTPAKDSSICTKSIKYTIEKVKMIEDGNEVKMHAEITFNPTTKLINLKADDPEKGKIRFDTEIESIDCSFNDNLTEGQAVYKGYIKQDDGSKSFTSFLIENKDGALYIKPADAQNRSHFFMIVDGWEIVSD